MMTHEKIIKCFINIVGGIFWLVGGFVVLERCLDFVIHKNYN